MGPETVENNPEEISTSEIPDDRLPIIVDDNKDNEEDNDRVEKKKADRVDTVQIHCLWQNKFRRFLYELKDGSIPPSI